MDRAELERLDRTALIAQAEALGVGRANILTRPELMDEVLVRTAKKDDLPRARGFFGRARDLVARVIEKGLHLPDAAQRLRQVSSTASQIAARVAPSVVPTVTLAEIYAAQGHRARAIETLRRVLELEPDHGAARLLLATLEAAEPTGGAVDGDVASDANEANEASDIETAGADERGATAQGEEPRHAEPLRRPPTEPRADAEATVTRPRAPAFLDDEPLPIRYDVDECVAIAIDPVTLYVYWEVRDATVTYLRRARPTGALTLRLLIVTPAWDGPRSAIRDFGVDAPIANRVVRDLPPGAVVRAAIGWRSGEAFLPIAHAPALETPAGAPWPVVADAFVRWTPRGLTPVTERDPDYTSIGRALGRLSARPDPVYDRNSSALGSSDLSAGFATDAGGANAAAGSSEAMSR